MADAKSVPPKGLAMGLADVVPGVSGGTVALALGIHPRLVGALAAFDVAYLKALFGVFSGADGRAQFAARFRAADTAFLLWLGLGIAAGIVVGALTLERLLHAYPVAVSAVFFGMIAVSVRIPWRHVGSLRASTVAAFVLAMGFALVISVARPLELPITLWALPLAGAVAVCAMVLPGISGAFLLVLMGLYEPVIASIGGLEWAILVPFALGAGIGLLSFAKGLDFLLRTHPQPAFAALAGLMVGGLGRVWPFRTGDFAEGSPKWWPDATTGLVGLLGILAGGALVVLAERVAASATKSHKGE